MKRLGALMLGAALVSCHGEADWTAAFDKCRVEGRCGDAGANDGGAAGAGGGTAGGGGSAGTGGTAGSGGGSAGAGGSAGSGGGSAGAGGTAGSGGGSAGAGGTAGSGGGSAGAGGTAGSGGGTAGAFITFPGGPVDFGSVGALAAATRRVVVSNDGGASSGLLDVRTLGVARTNFSIGAHDTCTNANLAPGASCDLDVELVAPADAGRYDARLDVTANGVAYSTPLSVTVVGPLLGVSPTDVAFGPVAIGTRPALPVLVQNVGLSPTAPLAFTFGPGVFGLDAGACVGRSLGADAGCTVAVSFAPLDAGVHAGWLGITAGALVFDAGLSGVAFVPGTLTLSELSWDAGQVEVGLQAATTFTVRNVGTASTGPLTVTPPSPPFAIVSNGCSVASLSGGATCDITLRYQPTAAGRHTAGLLVSAVDAGSVAAELFGEGVEYVDVTFLVDGGTGTGTLSGVPLQCRTGCALRVLRGTSFSVGGLGSNAFADGWSGTDCNGSDPFCTFAARSDAGHVNTAHFGAMAQLTVNATGVGALDLDYLAHVPQAPATGLLCDGSCTKLVRTGVPLRLHTTHEPGVRTLGVPVFAGGCSSSGQGWCDLTMTGPTTVTVDFPRANVAFVTSDMLASALGSATAFDGFCREVARDAGLVGQDAGSWVAWTWDGNISPAVRLGAALGWVRVDGQVVAPLALSATFHLRNTLSLDERGGDQANQFVRTGDNGLNCGNWASTSATAAGVGLASRSSLEWAGTLSGLCVVGYPVYCFQSNITAPLPTSFPVPQGGRRAFIGPSIPVNSSPAVANGACVGEAADAGLSNATAFVALRSSPAAAAVALLSADGGNWYRVDGVQLTRSPEDLTAAGKLLAAVDLQANGGTVPTAAVAATGSPSPTQAATTATSCNGWTGTGGTATVGTVNSSASDAWSDQSVGCTTTARVYCFER